MLPLVTSPKLSVATEFIMLSAARCSMMAFALPSRSSDTTNELSAMTSPSFRAALTRGPCRGAECTEAMQPGNDAVARPHEPRESPWVVTSRLHR